MRRQRTADSSSRPAPDAGNIFIETVRRVFDVLDGRVEVLEYILLGLMQITAANGRFYEVA